MNNLSKIMLSGQKKDDIIKKKILNIKDKDKKIQKKEEYIPYSCITGLEKNDLSFPKPLTEK